MEPDVSKFIFRMCHKFDPARYEAPSDAVRFENEPAITAIVTAFIGGGVIPVLVEQSKEVEGCVQGLPSLFFP